MQEANQSASAPNPSSNTAQDHQPTTLVPNQYLLPVAMPSPTAAGTPEPVKRPCRGDEEKQAPVGGTDGGNKNCDNKEKPANMEETDEKQPSVALKPCWPEPSRDLLWWPESGWPRRA